MGNDRPFIWSLGNDIPDLWLLQKIKRRDEIANYHRTQKDLVREKLGITSGFLPEWSYYCHDSLELCSADGFFENMHSLYVSISHAPCDHLMGREQNLNHLCTPNVQHCACIQQAFKLLSK